MSKLLRCSQNQSFKSKALASLILFFVVAIFLSTFTVAEEQKKEEKSGCPYLKATAGCCSADKACAEKKECKSKKDAKSEKPACDSKSQSSSCEKSCENKKVSSNVKCDECKCCSACNCTGQKQINLACSCGDNCKCCASCCSKKA